MSGDLKRQSRTAAKLLNFEKFAGRKFFITGHTGFKGAWLCRMLVNAGAEVTGYALEPPTDPSLYEIAGIEKYVNSIIGDVRDFAKLSDSLRKAEPETVIHMAAQPIVRESYNNPVYTYETNVMGTVNLLEACRHVGSVKSIVNVTTDKVYEDKTLDRGYHEDDVLCGHDAYANSKSCSDLATKSFRNSFYCNENTAALSAARSGNVIGGGDFAEHRLVPDCVRAVIENKDIIIRNPDSVRPFQHVLECLRGYLVLAMKQLENKSLAGSYNFGPDDEGCVTVGELTDMFIKKWGSSLKRVNKGDNGPHESKILRLDCAKAKKELGWEPRRDIKTAVEKTVEWTRAWAEKKDVVEIMDKQIKEYLDD